LLIACPITWTGSPSYCSTILCRRQCPPFPTRCESIRGWADIHPACPPTPCARSATDRVKPHLHEKKELQLGKPPSPRGKMLPNGSSGTSTPGQISRVAPPIVLWDAVNPRWIKGLNIDTALSTSTEGRSREARRGPKHRHNCSARRDDDVRIQAMNFAVLRGCIPSNGVVNSVRPANAIQVSTAALASRSCWRWPDDWLESATSVPRSQPATPTGTGLKEQAAVAAQDC
jgi:hypothetical protein